MWVLAAEEHLSAMLIFELDGIPDISAVAKPLKWMSGFERNTPPSCGIWPSVKWHKLEAQR
jgi:hypothetical protein